MKESMALTPTECNFTLKKENFWNLIKKTVYFLLYLATAICGSIKRFLMVFFFSTCALTCLFGSVCIKFTRMETIENDVKWMSELKMKVNTIYQNK